MSKQLNALPAYPSLWDALVYWFKLGMISFGGPAGQIALLHSEVVDKRQWMSERRFLHALNYCMLLPGPEAMQLVVYISWLLHGTVGAILAGLLFVLPAFVLLAVLAGLYMAWGDVSLVQGIFYGIKPAVVAIVLFAAWRIGQRTLTHPFLWGVLVAALVAVAVFDVGFPWVVLVAGVLGWGVSYVFPHWVHSAAHSHGAVHGAKPAVLDDTTPLPLHAQYSLRRMVLTLGVGMLLWLGVMAAVSGESVLTVLGVFFTKAAFLTIGGAYAVLPYVSDAAVGQYGWLTTAQMMDGLALGEATPGPLIIIVTWVGYIAGMTQHVHENSVVAGILGASVATFFTFLPSFLFVLVGAPLVEASRQQIKLVAPLTVIAAAIVGVILNLALFFALHTLWVNNGVDWVALLLTVGAVVALWRFKVNLMWVLAVCAVCGIGMQMLFE